MSPQTRRALSGTAVAMSLMLITACGTLQGSIALGAIGATALGASTVTTEIEQTYYLGVFDPQDQLPPEVYRVRVHGQASFIGFTRFASGWVPAEVVDSLGSQIGFEKGSTQLKITPAAADHQSTPQPGRRLVMFGPEGFREAPKGHRLVVVMGSDPEAFFSAIDQSLGVVAQVMNEQRNDALARTLFEQLVLVKSQRERLADLAKDVTVELAASGGAQ